MNVIDAALERIEAKREVQLIVLEVLAEADLAPADRKRVMDALRARKVI